MKKVLEYRMQNPSKCCGSHETFFLTPRGFCLPSCLCMWGIHYQILAHRPKYTLIAVSVHGAPYLLFELLGCDHREDRRKPSGGFLRPYDRVGMCTIREWEFEFRRVVVRPLSGSANDTPSVRPEVLWEVVGCFERSERRTMSAARAAWC